MPPPPELALPGQRGVANIRNRVAVLGARCVWQPLPGGTLFKLWLPLFQHDGDDQKKLPEAHGVEAAEAGRAVLLVQQVVDVQRR